ncbi:MAG: hypothetical protein ACE14V_16320 [bacterium]
MERTKTTELPLVTIKIPLATFIRLADTKFESKIDKLNLDSIQTKQVISAFEYLIT